MSGDASSSALEWVLPAPFIHVCDAAAADVDGFGHVNNAVYVRWLNDAAWAHSQALGVGAADCRGLDRGMVVRETLITYHASAKAGDRVSVGTWILSNDGRLRSDRGFQLLDQDGRQLARGLMRFVCVTLSSETPARMPPLFREAYAARPDVAAALIAEPWRLDGAARPSGS